VKKLAVKCFATMLSYSMVKIAHFKDASSEIVQLESNPVEGQITAIKGEKGKMKKELRKPQSLKTKDNVCKRKGLNWPFFPFFWRPCLIATWDSCNGMVWRKHC